MDTAAGQGPGNLPADLPTFVGRDAEVAELDDLIRTTRLTTVTGVAGVGKTRTSLRAAAGARDHFPDGVWVIPLSQLLDGGLVAHSIALEMKVRDQTARPMIELLIEHLTERRCLLILDTCEHLLAEAGLVAATLLEACPGVTVLATSRQPLLLKHEAVIDLAPLPTPGEPGGPPGEYASVDLFTERAREAVPDFALTDANRETIGELCRRLDGLPLALELAAAQLRMGPLEEVYARTGAPPNVMAPQGTPVLAPHGSLWTTIGWSHELCTPAERLLWARASMFAGSFTLEALQEVCAGGPVNDTPATLKNLVAKSIVVQQAERYRLLDSLREYGASWLRELGEEGTIRKRHRDRYMAMARQAFPEWTRAGQAPWYRRLSDDYPEVRLAVETSLAEPGPAALEIVSALWFFWFSCEFEREGRHYIERALDHDLTPGPLRVRAAWALGCVMIAQGDLNGIERCIRECRTAAPDPSATRAADYIEGTDWAMSGRPEDALRRLVALAEGPWEDPVQEAVWMLARAALVFAQVVMGDYGQATVLAEDLRADGAHRGEHKFRCWGHYIHSLVHLLFGDHTAAADHAQQAYEGFKRLDDSSNMALSLEVLALATAEQGDRERAVVLLGISERLWYPVGGRARFTAPQLAAARDEGERKLAADLGQQTVDDLFRTGLHSTWP